MKPAIDNQANISMAALFTAFIIVIGLFMVWPRSAGNTSAGYSDGTPVQSDTISPQANENNANSARK